MKIFVPKYRNDMPPENPWLLNKMMVEVSAFDLPRVIGFWQSVSSVENFIDAGTFFRTNTQEVCQHTTKELSLEPFLRRSHFVIHAGSQSGNERCSDVLAEAAYNAGKLVAQHGGNLWNGGGTGGLMKTSLDGFKDEAKKNPRPDQYSIQVIPADFVVGVKSTNGFHPKNEGLSDITDAAIIMPHFPTRRELLGSRCAAALSLAGSIGSLDEWSMIAVDIKTGLSDTNLYAINTYVQALGGGFYDDLRRQLGGFVKCGLLDKEVLKTLHFKETPEQAFADLMPKLKQKNATPDQVYDDYCKLHHVSPGIPMKGMPSTPSDSPNLI